MVVRKSIRLGAALLLLLSAVLLLSGSGKSVPLIEDTGDLDGDGKSEIYSLTDNVLSVKEGNQDLWKSPQGYRVDSFALGDIDNDGKNNLVISLWKKGSFGEMRPFWHTGEDMDYKNHLFVYQLQEKTFKPVWCSSNLDHPILSFAIGDINSDGQNELIIEEGQYKKIAGARYAPASKEQGQTTVWEWEEWGFRLRDSKLPTS